MLTKPKKSKITSEEVEVTPEMAFEWLGGNTHNRPITQARVDAFARDMKAGKWDLNGEPIIFDHNGVLQDGQHRLFACTEAGIPFTTMVTRGVDPSTFKTIDTGRARTAKDVLGIQGHVNITTLAAATGNVIRIMRGDPRSGNTIPNAEVLAFVEANPSLIEWVSKSRRGGGIESFSSLVAAILFIGAQKYPKEADDFLTHFKKGENLQYGSPILAVRNRLLTDKALTKAERLGVLISAWNAFVEGRSLTVVRVPTEFPKIKGSN